MNLKNIFSFALLVVAHAAVSGVVTAAEVSAKSPNIVIILADDMGYGDVRVLNSDSRIPTPNLDRLASDGMTFTDAHSPSGVCTPTRYGLVTGRYCWRSRLKNGVLGGYSQPLIERDRPTIASTLRAAGYRTGAVGKWHLGMALPMKTGKSAEKSKWMGDPGVDFSGVISDSPIHHGFDEYFGVSASLDMAPYVFIRNDRFTMQPTLQQPAVKFPHFVRNGPRAEGFVIDQVLDRLTEKAVRFIDKSADGDQPFFLYMPLTAPHKPTQPHERFRGKTSLGEYGDFVAQVDGTVGEVLKSLDQNGQRDNTLVIFTSDNGSYMHRYDEPGKTDHVDDPSVQGYRAENHRANGPLRGTKADIWEGGHRVPFFARWPREIKRNSHCDDTICHTDILATAAEVARHNLPRGAAPDSYSFLSQLADKKPATARPPVIHHSASGMFAIRDGDWKLVLGDGSGGRQAPRGRPFRKPYQLFNLADDLSESKNVIAEHPEIAARLENACDMLRKTEH